MAKSRRGIVEKIALVVGGLALAWLALNAGLAQLARADAEVIVVPGEVVLPLSEADQLVVYLRSGTNAASGFGVGPDAFGCVMRSEPVQGAEGTTVVAERIDETRTIDGWNPHHGFLRFSAPEDGTYALTCRLAGSSSAFPSLAAQLTTGVELHVAPPGPGGLEWVSPSQALVSSMLVLFPAGAVYVVAGAFARRD